MTIWFWIRFEVLLMEKNKLFLAWRLTLKESFKYLQLFAHSDAMEVSRELFVPNIDVIR